MAAGTRQVGRGARTGIRVCWKWCSVAESPWGHLVTAQTKDGDSMTTGGGGGGNSTGDRGGEGGRGAGWAPEWGAVRGRRPFRQQLVELAAHAALTGQPSPMPAPDCHTSLLQRASLQQVLGWAHNHGRRAGAKWGGTRTRGGQESSSRPPDEKNTHHDPLLAELDFGGPTAAVTRARTQGLGYPSIPGATDTAPS